MRTAWVAGLLLIGCGGAAPEPLPAMQGAPERPGMEWHAPEIVAAQAPLDDQQLRAMWQHLRLDGTNYQDLLSTIAPELREPLASVLLRDGDFRCEPVTTQVGCERQQAFASPEPWMDLDDACLRREVALWAVDQLTDEDTIASLFDALVELVRLPAPERELGDKALRKLPRGVLATTALWEAQAAGNHDLVADHIALLDDAELFEAVAYKHIDAAFFALLPDTRADSYVLRYVIDDDDLQLETRLAAIARIVELATALPDDDADRASLEISLRRRRNDANCSIASAAAGGLVALGARGAVSSGPFRTADAVVHATCATLGASGASGPAWKQVLTRGTLVATNHLEDPLYVDALWSKYPFAYDHDADGAPDVPEADADHDGVPSTYVETRSVKPGSFRTVPFADELKLALPHCDEGLVCPVPGTSVWFQLDIGKERGTKLRLRAIDRHETIGSDC